MLEKSLGTCPSLTGNLMPRLLVVSPHAERFAELIEAQALHGLEADYCRSAEEARALCGEAEILFGAPDQLAGLLDECGALSWVQSSWACSRALSSPSPIPDPPLFSAEISTDCIDSSSVFYIIQETHII